ncbi:MAG: YceI family protein [Saprospiraceae bacterium]|nr:YceI family protein [Saprospiraceae bacterium]
MQSFYIILFLWFNHLFIFDKCTNLLTTNEAWLVKTHSSLKVDGKTNINSFSCIVPSYNRDNDVIICEKTSNGCKIKSQLSIPILNFDCYHKVMTKDLQKTLKASIHPNMNIEFKSFTKLPSVLTSGSSFVANADITLAGVIRSFSIHFIAKKSASENIELVGKKTILFTEFGLTPPSKLGGTIKVKDELDVEFRLFLQKIN